MPRLALILIAFALFPAPAAAERVLIKTEGTYDTSHIVSDAVFGPDGETILTGGRDGTARLWNITTGRELRRFEGHTDQLWFPAFSPNGETVLIGGINDSAGVWDVETGREIHRLEGHSLWVRSVAFSPDGRKLVTGSEDNTARLWDAATGRSIQRFEGHESSVVAVTFNPDSGTVLTGSHDHTARLWDTETGSEIRRYKGHEDWVMSVDFSPDGERALTGSVDGTARLWDVNTGQEIRSFEGHNGGIRSVAFSPDGKTILTGGDDDTARLWDTGTGREIHRFEGNGADWSYGSVWSVAFSPNGKQVLFTVSTRIQRIDNGSDIWSSTVTLHDLPREVWPESPAPQAAPRPDALGLIIGNRDYDAAPEVDYALEDAAAYKAAFEEALGLDPENIFVLKNASSVEVQRWFGAPAAPEGRLHRLARHYDEVFVAYSGHGVPKVRAEGPAEGYLLPVDVPPGAPAIGGYPIGQLVAQLESVPVERITVFLDACFSGLTPAGELVPEVSGAFGVAVAPPEQEAKVSVLAATAFDRPQYAHWSPETENGVFTRHVVAGLRGAADSDGDGALRLSELHGYVGRKVVRETLRRADREQTPSLRSADSDQILATLK
jgi:Tol biopolymer transport system component